MASDIQSGRIVEPIVAIRIVPRANGQGAVCYARMGDSPEYVLNYYNIGLHTPEGEPAWVEFSRSKADFKKLGPIEP